MAGRPPARARDRRHRGARVRDGSVGQIQRDRRPTRTLRERQIDGSGGRVTRTVADADPRAPHVPAQDDRLVPSRRHGVRERTGESQHHPPTGDMVKGRHFAGEDGRVPMRLRPQALTYAHQQSGELLAGAARTARTASSAASPAVMTIASPNGPSARKTTSTPSLWARSALAPRAWTSGSLRKSPSTAAHTTGTCRYDRWARSPREPRLERPGRPGWTLTPSATSSSPTTRRDRGPTRPARVARAHRRAPGVPTPSGGPTDRATSDRGTAFRTTPDRTG